MTCTGFALLFVYMTCQQPAVSAGATFCTTYRPILWSAKDTRGTKEQVDKLNRAFKRICRQ